MLDQPFLAAAVARFPLVDATHTGWCETAATDGYHIYVNQTFLSQRTTDDVHFILAHEVIHCLLGHVDRRADRSRDVWNMAVDYAANALLVESGFALPHDALYDVRYAGLTAEAIYRALIAGLAQQNSNVHALGTGGTPLADGPLQSRRRFDRHVDPSDPEGAQRRDQEFPTRLERERLRRQLVANARNHLSGRTAGTFFAELDAAATREIDWNELLARFVTGLRRSDYRMFPPSRKHLWRGVYLSSLGRPGPEHLVFAIDTSGSMPDNILGRILGELDGLRAVSECRLSVMQCDSAIQRLDVFESFETSHAGGERRSHRLYGRGGTDLRPPFNWIRTQQDDGMSVDALIYCTDGFGCFPDIAPRIPVLWITPSHGLENFPFGDVLRMNA